MFLFINNDIALLLSTSCILVDDYADQVVVDPSRVQLMPL